MTKIIYTRKMKKMGKNDVIMTSQICENDLLQNINIFPATFPSRYDGFIFHIQNWQWIILQNVLFFMFLPYLLNKSPIKVSNYTNIVIYHRAHRIWGSTKYFLVLWDVLYNPKPVSMIGPLDFLGIKVEDRLMIGIYVVETVW